MQSMWSNLLEDPEAALALWEVAMAQQHATERQLEQARRSRNVRSIQTLIWELDELRYRADLLLANAVQAMRDSAPPELPVAVRRRLRLWEAPTRGASEGAYALAMAQ
jgi:hypothetical protein